MTHYRVYDSAIKSNTSFVVSVDNLKEAVELSLFWAGIHNKPYYVGTEAGYWGLATKTGYMVIAS